MHYESFCKEFGDYVPEATLVGERYYLLGEDLKGFRSGEQRKPYAAGLFLGMGKREFMPTPALLRLLAMHSQRKAVVASDHVEWLFLCGRDVFPEFFTSSEQEGFVLVQNERDENLGLGKIVPDKQKGTLLKNILDRGNYLRHDKVKMH
jgi:ribosome biogenesis protein Nip4